MLTTSPSYNRELVSQSDKSNKNPISEKDFLESITKQKSIINDINIQYSYEKIYETKEINFFEDYCDNKITQEELEIKLKELQLEKSKIKVSNIQENSSQKEKLQTFSILSNLAYSDFKKVDIWWEEVMQVENVKLDVLSFPNIDKIFNKPKPNWLTKEEETLYAYVNNSDIKIDNWHRVASNDIENIIKFTSYWKWEFKYDTWVRYADTDKKYLNYRTDVDKIPETWHISYEKRYLLIDWLNEVKKQKIVDNKNILEELKWKYEIVDYFPNDNPWKNISPDIDKSWFGAVCLKDNFWNLTFAIRWTDTNSWGIPNSWKDIMADKDLAISKVPKWQTDDMIKFIDRNISKLEKDKKVIFTGHSLWWALTQIATVMYQEKTLESCTFNSPWAKKLNINIDETDPNYEKFQKFLDNKWKGDIQELLTNVKWTKWISLIADLWEDIWAYEIKLENLSSHSIIVLINYIDNLKEDSEELIRIKIQEIIEEDKKIKK